MGVVWVVGSINEDLRLSVAHHVRPGETVLAAGSARELGGKGLNQAVAARRAGATTVMVGAVGPDEAGTAARALVEDEGMAARLFAARSPTGTAVVAVDPAGENAIVVVPGANAELTPGFAVSALTGVGLGDVVLLQLELPLPVVAAAAARARSAGATVVLNAAPVVPGTAGALADVDVLVVNAGELAALAAPATGDPAEAALRLAGELGRTLVVTLGGDGALLVREGTVVPTPACPTTVRDTTGAGDTHVGYLVAGLAAGLDLPDALDRAAAAAAVTVSRPGATGAIPREHELATAIPEGRT